MVEGRSTRLGNFYAEFRARVDASEPAGHWMPYGWVVLPEPISALWLVYSQMTDDYAADLANIINDLTHHVHRLRAWAEVVAPLNDDAKMEVAHEFLGQLGVASLSTPYAIKSRFTAAAANLCHQANIVRDPAHWVDVFPAKNLYLNDIDPFGAGWRCFRRFKRAVDPIAGRAFKAGTHDFRNAYNHGFPPRLLLGQTNAARRAVDEATGKVTYSLGGVPPLDLTKTADLLAIERDHCYRAFESFQALITEQTKAIADFEAAALAED